MQTKRRAQGGIFTRTFFVVQVAPALVELGELVVLDEPDLADGPGAEPQVGQPTAHPPHAPALQSVAGVEPDRDQQQRGRDAQPDADRFGF